MTTTLRDFRLSAASLLLSIVAALGTACSMQALPKETGSTRARAQPKIVVIMSDDMGYSDLGCFGGEIRTPRLDQLAANGVRWTQFYNNARCCPTRASLLTGRYSHSVGIGLMLSDRGHAAYRGDLSKTSPTIAEALRARGYRNYMSGKWHVTRHLRADGDKSCWPLQRGFDRFYGTIIGAGSYYDPATLCRGNTLITPVNDEEYRPERFYYTDAISDQAVRFVREHAETRREQPFFLYVSYTAAHWPMHAPEDVIDSYRGVYDEGYEATRAQRFDRARALGVIDEHAVLTPPAQTWAKARHKSWERRSMEAYAATVTCMDRGIGRLVDELERQGYLEDTLILFLQDNGACAEGYGRRSNADKVRGAQLKPMPSDALQTKIWPPMQTRDGRAVRTGPGVMAGAEDTFIAYGRAWANVSNTPFRGYKHDQLEGGIRTPLIAHWPKGLPSGGRASIETVSIGHVIDLMPTVLAVAGTGELGERVDVDGEDLLGALRGAPRPRSRPLFFEHHGNAAVRDGRWKLVSLYRKGQARQWQLFDLGVDPSETRDLAAAQPEVRDRLSAAWRAWAKRVGVQPWPFRRKSKAKPAKR